MLGEHLFSIIDAAELKTAAFDEAELPQRIARLAEEGFVSVKYADGAEYCLGATREGKALVREVQEERERRKQEEADKLRREADGHRQEALESQAQESATDVPEAESAAHDEQSADGGNAPACEDKPSLSTRDKSGAKQAPVAVPTEAKRLLSTWAAAFFGALLGGGIVGLVMYILHVTLQ